jgi:MinD-like ATPase involved in chromosome partitioning or flagellar assembly
MAALETKQRGRRAHLAVVGDNQVPETGKTKEPAYPINVLAIWGPSGSPGKSTIAINVAAELALAGEKVLLIDLDTLAPSLALGLGLVDTPAGLSACLRLAEQNRLTPEEFNRLTLSIALGRNELRFMSGLSSPHRWPEVTPERFEKLLHDLQGAVDHVVVDLAQATSFRSSLVHPSSMNSLESNRDTLLRSVLSKAGKVVLVSGSDPVAAQRFLVARDLLSEIDSSIDPFVVVNRFRTGALGSRAKDELEQTYLSLARLRVDVYVPEDRDNLDKAMLNGLPLALLKRSSPARVAIGELAKQLLISSPPRRSVAKL